MGIRWLVKHGLGNTASALVIYTNSAKEIGDLRVGRGSSAQQDTNGIATGKIKAKAKSQARQHVAAVVGGRVLLLYNVRWIVELLPVQG